MTFGTAIATGFRKYADFSGVAGRPEFWWFNLFLVLGSFVAGALFDPLSGVWFFATLLPYLAVGCPQASRCWSPVGAHLYRTAARSWHDRVDRSVVTAHKTGVGRRCFRFRFERLGLSPGALLMFRSTVTTEFERWAS
jgi:hypothetical protein